MVFILTRLPLISLTNTSAIMNQKIYSMITSTSNYLPSSKVNNEDFMHHEFFDSDGLKLKNDNREIIDKFQEITTIEERR